MLATTVGVDETLDTEYEIDSIEGGTYYRLFVEGSRVPLKRRETEEPEEDDLVALLFFPHRLGHLDREEHTLRSAARLRHGNHSRDVRQLFPEERAPQHHGDVLPPELPAVPDHARPVPARRPRVPRTGPLPPYPQIEAKVTFARLNCNGHSDFCTEKKVKTIPTFTFYPHKDLAFDGKQLETKRGEGIVLYLNEKLGGGARAA